MKAKLGGKSVEIDENRVRGGVGGGAIERDSPISRSVVLQRATAARNSRERVANPAPVPHSPPLSLCFTIPFQLQSGKNRVLITRTGHRYPPKRFQAWRDAVLKCIPPMAGPYTGPLHIIVDYVPGDKRKRDVPGMLDALLHVLERGRCMLDDAQVKQVTWTPFPLDRKRPRCTVTLSPMKPYYEEEA